MFPQSLLAENLIFSHSEFCDSTVLFEAFLCFFCDKTDNIDDEDWFIIFPVFFENAWFSWLNLQNKQLYVSRVENDLSLHDNLSQNNRLSKKYIISTAIKRYLQRKNPDIDFFQSSRLIRARTNLLSEKEIFCTIENWFSQYNKKKSLYSMSNSKKNRILSFESESNISQQKHKKKESSENDLIMNQSKIISSNQPQVHQETVENSKNVSIRLRKCHHQVSSISAPNLSFSQNLHKYPAFTKSIQQLPSDTNQTESFPFSIFDTRFQSSHSFVCSLSHTLHQRSTSSFVASVITRPSHNAKINSSSIFKTQSHHLTSTNLAHTQLFDQSQHKSSSTSRKQSNRSLLSQLNQNKFQIPQNSQNFLSQSTPFLQQIIQTPSHFSSRTLFIDKLSSLSNQTNISQSPLQSHHSDLLYHINSSKHFHSFLADSHSSHHQITSSVPDPTQPSNAFTQANDPIPFTLSKSFELISKHNESFLSFSQFLVLSIGSLIEKYGYLDFLSISSIAYHEFRKMQINLITTLFQEEQSALNVFASKNDLHQKSMKSSKIDEEDFRVFLCKIRQKKIKENPNVEYLEVVNEARSLWVCMSHEEKMCATMIEIS